MDNILDKLGKHRATLLCVLVVAITLQITLKCVLLILAVIQLFLS